MNFCPIIWYYLSFVDGLWVSCGHMQGVCHLSWEVLPGGWTWTRSRRRWRMRRRRWRRCHHLRTAQLRSFKWISAYTTEEGVSTKGTTRVKLMIKGPLQEPAMRTITTVAAAESALDWGSYQWSLRRWGGGEWIAAGSETGYMAPVLK